MLLTKMACAKMVGKAGILKNHCLFRHYLFLRHYTTKKVNHLTECHEKNTNNIQPSKTEDCDLDFFGMREADPPKYGVTGLSDEDRHYLKHLVDKYVKQPKPENVKETSFGTIRYDRSKVKSKNLNILSKSSNTGKNKTEPQSLSQDLKASFLDQSKNDAKSNLLQSRQAKNYSLKLNKDFAQERSNSSKSLTSTKNELSFVDEQYFGNIAGRENNCVREPHSAGFEKVLDVPDSGTEANTSEQDTSVHLENMGYIDDQYFNYSKTANNELNLIEMSTDESGQLSITKQNSKQQMHDLADLPFVDKQYFAVQNTQPTSEKPADKRKESRKFKSSEEKAVSEVSEKHISQEKHEKIMQSTSEKSTRDKAEMSYKGKPKVERKQTIHDVSIKIRQKHEKETGSNLVGKFDPKEYDTTGHKILKNQVPHFENVPSIDVVKVLRQSIIYDQNDVLAISKPYGLPSHDGPGVLHSVGSLLDQIIPKTQLYPVHRLDKDTTGVMLLARTEEMANKLSECFLKREITKRYLVITKNIPQMMSGEIDIPIAEGTVQGKTRMCLRPYKSPELSGIMRKEQPGTEAITRYKVLDMGKKCALLECIPVTGKKQQIRVHLAFGLNCPILGDHKFAHLNKLAPMRLHPEILELLNIQQSKVRYLPMHLHARSILIPEFFSGRNLYVSAPLPPHFVRNMKDLKLKLPPHS